jgi:regulatory protein
MAALEATPFLDDAAWARALVGGARGRGRSSALLRRELASKGVGAEDAALALAEHDDLEAARTLARRRAPALAELEPSVRRRRLHDFLARRGFGAGVIRGALGAVLDGNEDETQRQ